MADVVHVSHVVEEDDAAVAAAAAAMDVCDEETTPRHNILDDFATLSQTTNAKEKIERTVQILKKLHGVEDEKQVNYVLTRLIRGLAGSRTSTKKNYFVALTQLLRLSKTVHMSKIDDIMKKELHAIGSNTKSENANIHFGEILVCGSLIRSGFYSKLTKDEQQYVVGVLLRASTKRHYLTLAAYNFIVELYENIDERQFKRLWKLIRPAVDADAESVDAVYLVLMSRRKFPKTIDEYMRASRPSMHLVDDVTIVGLSEKLLTNPWLVKPQHPIYTSLGDEIIRYGAVDWCRSMDEHMKKPHAVMQTVCTVLLTDVIERLDDTTVVPHLLTPNYLLYTFNAYRSDEWRDKDFTDAMERLFSTLERKLRHDDTSTATKMDVLSKFLRFPGDIKFDSLTRSKIVQSTTAGLDAEGVKALIKLYKDILLVTDKETTIVETRHGNGNFSQQDRGFAAITMAKLLKHQSLNDDKDYKLKMMKFFVRLVFVKEESFGGVSTSLTAIIKPHFYTMLDHKMGKLEDVRDTLYVLIDTLDRKMTANPYCLRTPLAEHETDAWKEMIAFSDRLQTKRDDGCKLSLVFHVVCLQMGFQVFRDVKLAATSLKDIRNCYDEGMKQLGRSKKKKSIDGEQTMWIEVVVDMFLNFLSMDSHLLRNVIGCVFPHLCPYMNRSAFKRILDALDSNDENPLSDNDSSDDENEDDANDDDDAEESESSSSEDDDDQAEDDDKDDKLQALRMSCSEALGLNDVDSDAESINVDDITEEEGQRVDALLADCFRKYKPKTNKQLKREERKGHGRIATFRSRVIDLIVIYINSEPPIDVCLDMIPYLLHATYWSLKTDNSNLSNRVRSVLGRLSKVRGKATDGTDIATIADSWTELHERNENVSSNLLKAATEEIVSASTFMLRSAQVVENGCATDSAKAKCRSTMYAAVRKTLDATLADNDLIVIALTKKMFEITYVDCARIVDVLIGYAFKTEQNWFKRCRFLKLVCLFFQNNRLLTVQYERHPTVMTDIWKTLAVRSLGCLEYVDATETNNSVHKFMEILFVLFAKLKTGPFKEKYVSFDWCAFGALAQTYRQRCRSKFPKLTKTAYRQLCLALKIPIEPPIVSINGGTVEKGKADETLANGTSKRSKKRKNENVTATLVNGTTETTKTAKKKRKSTIVV